MDHASRRTKRKNATDIEQLKTGSKNHKRPKTGESSTSNSIHREPKSTKKAIVKSNGKPEEQEMDDAYFGEDGFFTSEQAVGQKSGDISGSDAGSVDDEDEINLRKGQDYLAKVLRTSRKVGEEEKSDDSENEDEITLRLTEEALQSTGKMSERKVAEAIAKINTQKLELKWLKGHQLSVTCVRIDDQEKTVYSASKDCCIVKWDLATGKKLAVYKGRRNDSTLEGHQHQILALALSSDGKYLASGGKDKQILIWDTEMNTLKDAFSGHKDAITALSFRIGSHDLYSGSDDRTLKLWNIDEMAYLDTLFGHKAEITAMDCLARDRPVTCSVDKTAAVWKIAEESNLEFLGPRTTFDCIALLTEEMFVTGGQNGSIHLWTTTKRRPLFEFKLAHGNVGSNDGTSTNWITAIGALRYSDLFASGSGTGEIILWKVSPSKEEFSEVMRIQVSGIINSIQFSKSGSYVIAGVGKEHRLGRWIQNSAAKNGTVIIPITTKH